MNFDGLTSEVLFLFEHEGNIDVKASPIIIHVTRMLDCELIELNCHECCKITFNMSIYLYSGIRKNCH